MPYFKYLDVIDLPSDPNGSLGPLRTAVRRAYNENRDYTDKLKLLSDTLATVIGMIEAGFEEDALKEQADQEAVEATIPVEVETPADTTEVVAQRPPRKPTTKD